MIKRLITLGIFDGVHIGHQYVIKYMYDLSISINCLPTIFTFNFINTKNRSIDSSKEKIKKIKKIHNNIEVILCDFNSGINLINWYDYLYNIILNEFNIFGIVVGLNNKFGYQSEGNIYLLNKFCEKFGLYCYHTKNVVKNNINISSTYIKNLIINGDIENANKFLGYNYYINGIIKSGKKIGRIIGYNTINIDYESNIIHLPNGVYITRTLFENNIYNSITNIGIAPTFINKTINNKITIETHILNFNQYVYNKNVTIQFLKFIRNEIKFQNLDELKNQIYKDILIVKNFIKMKDII